MPSAFVDWNRRPVIHRVGQLPSTLDLIHRLAEEGVPTGTVVVAEEQLEGRGTRGRTWHSPPGGFWYSILYRDVNPHGVEVLSLRIGLAVASAIESVVPFVRLGLKWPNDLMLGDRKLGGVLCEARWQGETLGWVAVGIGINVTNPLPVEVETTAIRLQSVAPVVTVEQLVEPITFRLRGLPLETDRLSSTELADFQGRDWLQGQKLTEPVPGIARGITTDGSLLVEQEDGTVISARAGRSHLG
jgi:BirA family biotin operon repressor/biotin-[acetyl-CoA-carboxylase] ligase